jgi:hypothetical protein
MDHENTSVGTERDDRRIRQIRSEIDDTRSEMSQTVEEIQDRLSPGHVASRVAHTVRDATIGRVRQAGRGMQHSLRSHDGDGQSWVDQARLHPLPIAMAVGSLTWLALSSTHGRQPSYRGRAIYGTTRGGAPALHETEITDEFEESASSALYGDGSSGDGADEGAWRTTLRDAGDGVRRSSQNRPIAMGAVAAGIGVAIGLLMPATEREQALMGDARDGLIERARGAAKEAAEQVQDTAKQVQSAAATVIAGTQNKEA